MTETPAVSAGSRSAAIDRGCSKEITSFIFVLFSVRKAQQWEVRWAEAESGQRKNRLERCKRVGIGYDHAFFACRLSPLDSHALLLASNQAPLQLFVCALLPKL